MGNARSGGSGVGSRVPGVSKAFPLVLVVAAAVYVLQTTLLPGTQSPNVHIPLHASSILEKCKSLSLKPGPSPTFSSRLESDRFQNGTRPVYIRNATIWTGRAQGLEIIRGDLLVGHGLIKAFGVVPHELLKLHDDLHTIDARGAWVTPGLVDVHSHLGVISSPGLQGADDVNAVHGPILPWLRSLDGLNTHDDGYEHSIAGGVTTSLILPGSNNAIGGQAFAIKLRPTNERSPSSMLLEPPFGLNGSEVDLTLPPRWRHMKHACGENPARAYGDTRMDTTWAYRQAYETARKIKVAQDDYCSKALAGDWTSLEGRDFPDSLQWEALVDLLRGRVKVHTHCYEALDFDNLVRMSNEFGFPVAAFHHASEAYLVPNVLKRAFDHTPAVATFAMFGRAKREFFRHSEFAPRVLAEHDIPVIMKSDHPALFARFLMHEAAQAHYYGLVDNLALASVTSTSAQLLGLDHRIGYIKEGYDADLVIWDSHPLSLGATPSQVLIDGIPQFSKPYAVDKPSPLQAVPTAPNFDREAAETVAYEGLPPLAPRRSTARRVILTGVAAFYSSSHAADALGGVVVVQGGRVICAGSERACAPYLSGPEIETIDLQGGAVQPGLTAFTSTLGLEEIILEPSTRDGAVLDPLRSDIPSIAGGDGYFPRALDGLQYGSRNALLAYRSGVTTAISAPTHTGFLSGLSVAFSLGAPHKLAAGAVVQDVAAVHVAIAHGGVASVSTEITALRRYLLDPPRGETGRWFAEVVNGTIPLVVDVHNADIMATLLNLKKEVEETTGTPIRLTLSGATEAHLLAKELGEAGVGVVLMTPRPYPLQWDQRRILAGPPLSEESTIARLLKHNVTVGIGPQGTVIPLEVNAWAARNLRFDAAWALGESPDILTKSSAFALAGTNVQRLLGVQIAPGDEDLVVTSGGDLLGFEGKVLEFWKCRASKNLRLEL